MMVESAKSELLDETSVTYSWLICETECKYYASNFRKNTHQTYVEKPEI